MSFTDTPDRLENGDWKKGNEDAIRSTDGTITPERSLDASESADLVAPMASKKALIGWLILCYSVRFSSPASGE